MKALKALLLFTAALILAGPAAAEVKGPELNWRFATGGKPRASTTHIEEIKKYVEKETNGRFTITIGYGTFGGEKEFLDLLKIGSIHGATVQASLSVDRLPLYTVLDLPFLPLADPEIQARVHDAMHENPAIRKEFEAWNALPFMSSLLPQYEIMGKGATPKKLTGLKGLRVRALGGAGNALAKIGAVPNNMPASETYIALDRGLLDAVAFPYYAYVSFKTYELGKWMTTNLALGTTAFPLALNLKAWNELPAQYKQLLEDARKVAYAAQKAAMVNDAQKAFDTIKNTGMELVEFGGDQIAELRAVGGKPIWDEWVKAQNARGLAGQEMLDFVLKTAARK